MLLMSVKFRKSLCTKLCACLYNIILAQIQTSREIVYTQHTGDVKYMGHFQICSTLFMQFCIKITHFPLNLYLHMYK